jgi:hypothetical protein
MLSEDDASNLTIPLAMYISKDEPIDKVFTDQHAKLLIR